MNEALIQSIIGNADAGVIAGFAESSKQFGDALRNSNNSTILSQRFGWILRDDPQSFIDMYYSKHLTCRCLNYYSPDFCLKWALSQGNMSIATMVFEFMKRKLMNARHSYYYFVYALMYNGDDYMVPFKWCLNNLEGDDVIGELSISQAVKSGNIQKLNDVAEYFKSTGSFLSMDDLLISAVQSGSIEMVEHILSHPTHLKILYGFTQDEQQYKKMLLAALASNRTEMVNYVINNAKDNGIIIKVLRYEYFNRNLFPTTNYDLLRKYILPIAPKFPPPPDASLWDYSREIYDYITLIGKILAQLSEQQFVAASQRSAEIASNILSILINEDLHKHIIASNYGLELLGSMIKSTRGGLKMPDPNILAFLIEYLKSSPANVDQMYFSLLYKNRFSVYNVKKFYDYPTGKLYTTDKIYTADEILSKMRINPESHKTRDQYSNLDVPIYNRSSDVTGIPEHPAIHKIFRQYGQDDRIYELDLINAVKSGNDDWVESLIISYHVDPSENDNAAIITAAQYAAPSNALAKDPRVNAGAQDNMAWRLFMDKIEIQRVKTAKNNQSHHYMTSDDITTLMNLCYDPRVDTSAHENKYPWLPFSLMLTLNLGEGEYGRLLENLELREISLSNDTYQEKYNGILRCLTQSNTEYRSEKLKIIGSDIFRSHYLRSNEELSAMLNDRMIPFIPGVDHFAAAWMLTHLDTREFVREEFDNIWDLTMPLYAYLRICDLLYDSAKIS